MQNGAGYAGNEHRRIVCTTIMCMLNGFMIVSLAGAWMPLGYKVAAIVLSLLSLVTAIGVDDSFSTTYSSLLPVDIHLHETITTGAFVLALCAAGCNMVLVACSVYPGLIVHKALINAGSGKPWNYHGTDDPTGKTFNIPTLGIRIPRESHKARMILAGISLAIAAICFIYKWGIWLAPLRISYWSTYQ